MAAAWSPTELGMPPMANPRRRLRERERGMSILGDERLRGKNSVRRFKGSCG
ncbi:hypothetical protein FH972_005426 [Carpinus fangiana]|uniref:Uncharacterized protein n=1 Tax=Carpinus fangiana TaxID=176857 RepID=A0A5N6QR20_9ROSI|nr:hypothetical protein FH972_005426 [Carpinus fangiana]